MGITSAIAIFFIIWWLVLFAVLPFGLKTQEEDESVTLGTVPSAPGRSHMRRALIRTTIVAAIVFTIYYVASQYYGIGVNSLPHFIDMS